MIDWIHVRIAWREIVEHAFRVKCGHATEARLWK
jgi:hypothetical protein